MLRDGSYAEIPRGADVIHRPHHLLCLNGRGELLVRFDAADVLAYTCKEAIAREMMAEYETDESKPY